MGSCCTGNDANSRYIDNKLKEQELLERSFHKLLFLGPGGSGKSTIFKQLQWLHGDGYSDGDVEALTNHIHGQIISQMQDAIKHYLHAPVDDEKLQSALNTVRDHPNHHELSEEIAECIAFIWKNDVRLVGIFTQNHTKKVLDETTEYFWNDVNRIKHEDFHPNKADIMNIRNRTTGIIEKKFTIQTRNFHIFDVGGQKSERKKWIKCFHDVRAVIFVVALSSYNENMFEDENKNYMVDALDLFDKTIHHDMFTETPIILFLNKKDLFLKKIKVLPITCCPAFEDYESTKDPHDFEQATNFIKEKFEEVNTKPRRIYTHLTCAMDDENIRCVFNDITTIIFEELKQTLSTAHIL